MNNNEFLNNAIEKVIEKEGGEKYTNNVLDKGGPTRWGVTETEARAFGYKGDVRVLPYETAFEIYKKRFWIAPKFYILNDISEKLAQVCFDWGVNSGPSVPVKALQRCLNVLNNGEKYYKDINTDGVFGSITQYCLNSFVEKRKEEGLEVLIKMIISLRSVFYIEIAEKNKTQETFEYGWQRRSFFE